MTAENSDLSYNLAVYLYTFSVVFVQARVTFSRTLVNCGICSVSVTVCGSFVAQVTKENNPKHKILSIDNGLIIS